MRNFAKWLLLSLLILPSLTLVIVYFILQTSYATRQISQWVTAHSPYQLQIEQIKYSFLTPRQLELQQVVLSDKYQPMTLQAQSVVVQFNWQQLSNPYQFTAISLENGEWVMDFANTTSSAINNTTLPVSSRQLILKNMAIKIRTPNLELAGQQVNAGISPWRLANPLQYDQQFQVSAKKVLVNQISIQNALLQGKTAQGQLWLDNLGGDLARGQITGRLNRTTDGQWTINNLRLSNLKWQTEQTLNSLIKRSESWPPLTIQNLDVINSTLEGKNWAASDLNLFVSKIAIAQGKVNANEGEVTANATNIVYNDLQFNEPLVKLALDPQSIEIKQFSSRWRGGLVRSTGIWQSSTSALTLNDITIAGVEYVLPENWLANYQQATPDWLKQLTIERLSANRNILIGIDANFPFQLTMLEGDGTNLRLIENHKVGIWSGQLTLNAHNATFNKVDLRQPMLSLSADQKQITISELGGLTTDGVLEATAKIDQQVDRDLSVTLHGQNIPPSILTQWGWRDIPLSDNANIELTLQRQQQKTTGRLVATDKNGQQVIQLLPQSPSTDINDLTPVTPQQEQPLPPVSSSPTEVAPQP